MVSFCYKMELMKKVRVNRPCLNVNFFLKLKICFIFAVYYGEIYE